MNKNEINRLLPDAYDVLKTTGIADEKDQIVKTYRGYISTFGAAVYGGSLLAAIAFFSDQGDADCDRTKLMKALHLLMPKEENDAEDFFAFIRGKIRQKNGQVNVKEEAIWKEKIINASIALKLAMNMYKFVKDEGK